MIDLKKNQNLKQGIDVWKILAHWTASCSDTLSFMRAGVVNQTALDAGAKRSSSRSWEEIKTNSGNRVSILGVLIGRWIPRDRENLKRVLSRSNEELLFAANVDVVQVEDTFIDWKSIRVTDASTALRMVLIS